MNDKRPWMHPETKTSSQSCCGLSLPRSSIHWQSLAMKTFLAAGQWNASVRPGWWETLETEDMFSFDVLFESLWGLGHGLAQNHKRKRKDTFMPFHATIPYPVRKNELLNQGLDSDQPQERQCKICRGFFSQGFIHVNFWFTFGIDIIVNVNGTLMFI